MKFARSLALLSLTAVLISACGKDEAEQQKAAAEEGGQNSLLALVPADTPYLGGNLQPVPDAIIDNYLTRFEPALVSLEAELDRARAELASNPDGEPDDQGERLLHALLQEVDGKLNRAGLESLGFDLSAESVVYGMSAFPVMRTSLSDASTLRATVQRVLDKAAIEAPQLEFQGQSYWRIIPDTDRHGHDADSDVDVEVDTDAGVDVDINVIADRHSDSDPATDVTDDDDNADVAIYVSILSDHLAVGMLPIASEAAVLPAFLGLEKPADSVAADKLGEINQRFGYTPYGTGVLDLQKFADELLNPDSLIGQLLASEGHDLANAVSDQCRSEFNSIVAHTPYFYTGITELSETAVGNQMVVQTGPGIAAELINLVSDVPVANASSALLAELALGLKVGPLRDFLRSKAMAVIEQPYQCEHLVEMNTRAQEAADQLNQPIPPMVNNLLGLRVAISRLGVDQTAPESAEGMIALHVTQPEMLVGMAQMLVPSLAELKLAPGEPPVQIPSDVLPIPGVVLYAAQSQSALGFSVGEGQQQGLTAFINEKGKANGTFLSVNYDTATYLDMAGQMGAASMDADDSASTAGVVESFQSVYKSMADRSDTRVAFTKDGLVIDSNMTFKNP